MSSSPLCFLGASGFPWLYRGTIHLPLVSSSLISLAFYGSHGSLLVATLFHTSLNIAASLLLQAVPMTPELAQIRTGLLVLAAILAVFLFEARNSGEVLAAQFEHRQDF